MRKKKKKKSHKKIFTWLGNLPTFTELQGFHYFQEKIYTRCGSTIFSLKNNTKTLILKIIVFL